MEKKDLIIKGKTIFDFCKDEKIRNEIIGGHFTESYYKGFPNTVVLEHLLKYSQFINDKDLFDVVRTNLDVAIKEAENRQNDAMLEGVITD